MRFVGQEDEGCFYIGEFGRGAGGMLHDTFQLERGAVPVVASVLPVLADVGSSCLASVIAATISPTNLCRMWKGVHPWY